MRFFSATLAIACAVLYAQVLNSCTVEASPDPPAQQLRIYTFLHRGW